MTRTRAALAILGSLAMTAGLLYVAAGLDLLGMLSNLIADGFVAAVVTVLVGEWLRRRAPRKFELEYSAARDNVLEQLRVLASEVLQLRSWTRESLHNARFHPLALNSFPGHLWRQIRIALEQLEGDYGTLDFLAMANQAGSLHEAVLRDAKEVLDALGAEVTKQKEGFAWLDPDPGWKARHADLTATAEAKLCALGDSLSPAKDKIRLLIRTIEQGYPVNEVSERYHPRPFPRWISILGGAVGALAATAWAGSYIFQDRLPNGLADGTTNNVLSAGAVTFIGIGAASLGRYLTSRRIYINSARPYHGLAQANLALIAATKMSGTDRDKLLDEISRVVRQHVNELQHVVADARLDRYVDQLMQLIHDYRKNENEVGALRLLESGDKLTGRVHEVYIAGRSM